MTETSFPTEFIELPSKGHFYPEDNPLSSGKVEMKYMTAREEDILTSVNLVSQGKALDKLLEELIVDKKVDYTTLLVGDKNALLVGARILAYGKKYGFSFIDVYGKKVNTEADLTKLKEKKLDLSKFEKGVNSFSYTLPKLERTLTYSIPTHTDEINADIEIDAINKVYNKEDSISRESSTRLKHLIKSVDGNIDRKYINNFVDKEFLSVDSLSFRSFVLASAPDIDFTVEVKNSQGEKERVAVPMTADFFWPKP
jgi:hypothetical protein